MEYSWLQFQNLDHIRRLPLNEQTRQYQFYLDSLANQRINQNKGDSGYILLEQQGTFEYPLDYLLNEDGTRIRRE
jgi:hypothetical protein